MSSPSCSFRRWGQSLRLLGDPVDVVTGAQTFNETDFRLKGDHLPFEWGRHYDSRHHRIDRGVGPGFRLFIDVELRFDLDGIAFTTFEGEEIHFPVPGADGDELLRQGHHLTRVDAATYRVSPPDSQLTYEFHFGATPIARLALLLGADDQHRPIRLQYDRDRLVALRLNATTVVALDYTRDRLTGATLWEDDGAKSIRLCQYTYDAHDRLIAMENAYGGVLRHGYDDHDRLNLFVDRRGYSFHHAYDDQGRCIHTMGQDGVEEYRFEYKPLEGLTIATRGDGAVTQYFFDERQNLVQIIDPCGGATVFLQDDDGKVIAEVDPIGNKSEILYDERDQPYAKRDPLGHIVYFPEGSREHPLSHRLPQNPLQWEQGDWPGRPDAPAVQAAPALPDFVTKKWGESPVPTLPKPVTIRDRHGLPVREEREDGLVRRWGLDHNTYYRWYQDFDGKKTHYEYGSWNHLLREQDPLGGVTEYGYTIAEDVAFVVDPLGTRHDYAYDPKDRLVEVRRHGKVREQYRYDAADNLLEKLDGQGKPLLTFAIGPGNQKKQRLLASGDVHDFQYTKDGRFSQVKSRAGTVEFKYTVGGRRTHDLRDGKGVQHRFVANPLAQTTVLDRFVTKYIRIDVATTIVLDPAGGTQRLRVLGPGLVERGCSNNVEELAQYDVQGRLLLKASDGPGMGKGWARRFKYSGEGDLLERDDNQRGATRYLTDDNHRLTFTQKADWSFQEYTYDKAGNLLKAPGLSATMQSGNRLLEANGDRFTYNDRDHVAERSGPNGTWKYTYDSRDQLIGIEGPGLCYQAVHDGLGRRTQKTVNGQTWTYYWDTDRLAAEVFPDGRLRVYVYPDAFAWVPMLFIEYASIDADPASGTRYHIHTDHLGCPELIVSDLGQTVWKASFDPYGTAHIEIGQDFHQPLRWPGHYHDPETGLHENRFRSYSPELGRYLQSDPIGTEGGLNLYAYTDNPTKAVDLRGQELSCPDHPDCPDNPKNKKQDGDDQEGPPRKKGKETELVDEYGKPKKPLAEMSDQELQDFTKQRAEQLNASLHPQEASRTTTAVTVVETPPGNKASRKVVITSSENREPKMPNKVGDQQVNPRGTPRDSALAEGETFRETPPHLSKKGTVKNENGDDVTVDNTGDKSKRRDYFDENNEPYTKAVGGDETTGETRHHAEQRAVSSKGEDEGIAAMSPTKPCCAGCQNALDNSGDLDKVHPDLRGK